LATVQLSKQSASFPINITKGGHVICPCVLRENFIQPSMTYQTTSVTGWSVERVKVYRSFYPLIPGSNTLITGSNPLTPGSRSINKKFKQ